MKKLLTLLIVLLMISSTFAACTKKPPVIDGENSGSSAPEEIKEPEVPPYTPHPLTGEEMTENFPLNQRHIALMINNIRVARPQSGIDSAEVIFEMVTEGGITRLMGIFTDYTELPKTGPIRSARDQHVQQMIPLNTLYVHIGGSPIAKQMLKDYEWQNGDIDGDRHSSAIYQDKTRVGKYDTEHTKYTDAEHIQKAIDESGFATKGKSRNLFDFVNYDDEPRLLTGGTAIGMRWLFSQSYDGTFDYDPTTNKYMKSQFGVPHIDENNSKQIGFENVLVLFTDIVVYPGHEVAGLMKVDYRYGGLGYYFYGGAYEKVRWVKGAPDQRLIIVSDDGTETPALINTGKSFIAFVDNSQYRPMKILNLENMGTDGGVKVEEGTEKEIAD